MGYHKCLSDVRLKLRVDTFLNEMGITVTAFTKNVGISKSSFYKWMSEERNISYAMQRKISDYLENYGF